MSCACVRRRAARSLRPCTTSSSPPPDGHWMPESTASNCMRRMGTCFMSSYPPPPASAQTNEADRPRPAAPCECCAWKRAARAPAAHACLCWRGREERVRLGDIAAGRNMSGHLVAILHSEPLGLGVQTLRRVDIARRALDLTGTVVANIFPRGLRGTNELGRQTEIDSAWADGRDLITGVLDADAVTDVLLGFGVNPPSGPQRGPYRQQVTWLSDELVARRLRCWGYGGRPTHPSRWQREAYRFRPGATVEELAPELLKLIDPARLAPQRVH